MKVSVIVPMYNVEVYIGQCLESLCNQSLKDMEVIVVDDGCSDSSCSIVEDYIKLYPEKIRLVHKQNGGLSDARNYGLQFARGAYIGFLDSDDYIRSDMYEALYNKIIEGYDVVVCDIEYVYDDISKNFLMKGLIDINQEDISKRALLSPMFAWNKLYKASFFEEFKYPLGTWYEDIPVTSMIFALSRDIGYVNKTLVYYRQREGSIMASKSNRLVEIFNIMEMVRDNFNKKNIYTKYRDELEYLHIEHLRLYGMFRFIRSNDLKNLYTKSEVVMKTYFPSWKKNKYIKYLSFKNRLFLNLYNRYTSYIFNLFIR